MIAPELKKSGKASVVLMWHFPRLEVGQVSISPTSSRHVSLMKVN